MLISQQDEDDPIIKQYSSKYLLVNNNEYSCSNGTTDSKQKAHTTKELIKINTENINPTTRTHQQGVGTISISEISYAKRVKPSFRHKSSAEIKVPIFSLIQQIKTKSNLLRYDSVTKYAQIHSKNITNKYSSNNSNNSNNNKTSNSNISTTHNSNSKSNSKPRAMLKNLIPKLNLCLKRIPSVYTNNNSDIFLDK